MFYERIVTFHKKQSLKDGDCVQIYSISNPQMSHLFLLPELNEVNSSRQLHRWKASLLRKNCPLLDKPESIVEVALHLSQSVD